MLPFQLMDNGANIDLVPSCHTNSEVARVKQAFTIEGASYPLDLDGIKTHASISKPTPK